MPMVNRNAVKSARNGAGKLANDRLEGPSLLNPLVMVCHAPLIHAADGLTMRQNERCNDGRIRNDSYARRWS
jgi:hypothetical protein